MSRLLQVIIALVGLTLTLLLGLASERSENLQTKHALLVLFSDSISVARLTCDTEMTFVAEDALKRLRELETARLFIPADEQTRNLESIEKYQDNLNVIRGTLGTPRCIANAQTTSPDAPAQTDDGVSPLSPPPPLAAAPPPAPEIVAQSAVRAQTLEFRQEQNTAAAEETRSGQFYAVLASYEVNNPNTYDANLGATAHYNDLAARAGAVGLTVQVFRTRVSRHYAIVLVPEGRTRDAARELVSTARRNGWSPDAFVQEARDWTPCPNAGTRAGLEACRA